MAEINSIVSKQQSRRNSKSPVWCRVIVFFIGGVILTIGLLMLALPGPAFIFIPVGLAILGTEFPWARKWLSTTRQWVSGRFQRIRSTKSN